MRFVLRCPIGNSPEGIHHSSRSIGKLIREPPLIAERSMGLPRESLKVSDPVVGPVCFFFVGHVPCLGIVQSLDGGQPRAMAIATLVRSVAAEFLSITLFRSDGCAVNDVLWPFRRGLHPID